jgi:hypothetical protein
MEKRMKGPVSAEKIVDWAESVASEATRTAKDRQLILTPSDECAFSNTVSNAVLEYCIERLCDIIHAAGVNTDMSEL